MCGWISAFGVRPCEFSVHMMFLLSIQYYPQPIYLARQDGIWVWHGSEQDGYVQDLWLE